MIEYTAGSFGFQLLFRMHGSAVFKSLTPALISCGIFFILNYTTDTPEDLALLSHPYPMGALIAALTFLLAYRANFAYQRYWEAYGNLHQMHSKWLDVGMELASFHLQAAVYDPVRPPSFGSYPHLTSLQRERERLEHRYSLNEIKNNIEEMDSPEKSLRERVSNLRKNKNEKQPPPKNENKNRKSINAFVAYPTSEDIKKAEKKKGRLHGFTKKFLRKSNKRGVTVTIETAKSIPKAWPDDAPPLFLQEAAHLLSLLSAVSMSTLRNDLEQAESPLIPFIPNEPWPHVDPDSYNADIRQNWESTRHKSYTLLRYWLGFSRTPAARTLYNAARPFRVIGGISDAEVELLQAARGPLAKYALCTMWLVEYMSREYLNGATGNVAPPILSRLYQFLSDGGIGYNQARKIAYTPFPFPHAQITSLFILIVVGFLPVLMLAFMQDFAFAFCLNFLTVLSFTGVHEVARELENPFINAPNDVPLNNMQAQFNEALMTMFFGFHPDAYWQVKDDDDDNKNVLQSPTSLQSSIREDSDESSASSSSSSCSDGNGGNQGNPTRDAKHNTHDNKNLVKAIDENTPLVIKGLS